jgi:hypothetical protein
MPLFVADKVAYATGDAPADEDRITQMMPPTMRITTITPSARTRLPPLHEEHIRPRSEAHPGGHIGAGPRSADTIHA